MSTRRILVLTSVLLTLVTSSAIAKGFPNFHDQRQVGFVEIGAQQNSKKVVKPRIKRGSVKSAMGKDWSKKAVDACKRKTEAFSTKTRYGGLVSWTVKCPIKPQQKALVRYWNAKEKDNNTSGVYFKNLAAVMGYNQGSIVEGTVRVKKGYGHDVRLQSWYHAGRRDFMTIGHPESIKYARKAGYKFRTHLGYMTSKSNLGCALHLYYHPKRGDHFSTALREGKASAKKSGYKLLRIEGYVGGIRPGYC